jgi:hypothetical protein
MALRGVSRATLDIDILVTSRKCLVAAMWDDLRTDGARVEVRRGDSDDPLAGVVRLDLDGTEPVDVVVGRSKWQDGVLDRAVPEAFGKVRVPVAVASDLVLLKLFAGGAQDRWDIEQLLAGTDSAGIRAEVTAALTHLPVRCRRMWRDIQGRRL